MEAKIPENEIHSELAVLKQLQSDVSFLKQRVSALEAEMKVIDSDIHEVRPEYLKKLARIEKGKFHHFKNMDELRKMIETSD